MMEHTLNYAEEKPSLRRIGSIGFVVLLHVGIIYALLNGLGEQVTHIFQQPLQVKIVQQVQPPELAPPPPPPPQMLVPPPTFIPPPLVQIMQPQSKPIISAVTHTRPVTPPPTPQPAPQPVQRGAGLDPNQGCAPPQYPQDAADMEETGVSVLQFLISANRNVVSSRIMQSSGFPSLDTAARYALGQCKFKPAIGVNGQPQEAWTSIRYVWTLN